MQKENHVSLLVRTKPPVNSEIHYVSWDDFRSVLKANRPASDSDLGREFESYKFPFNVTYYFDSQAILWYQPFIDRKWFFSDDAIKPRLWFSRVEHVQQFVERMFEESVGHGARDDGLIEAGAAPFRYFDRERNGFIRVCFTARGIALDR